MDAKTLFGEKLPHVLQTQPDKAKELNAVYLFKIDGDRGGIWTVDLKADTPSITEGEGSGTDCTVEISDVDFETLLEDTQQGMQLFMEGRLKVSDPMLATKLVDLLSLA